MIQNGGFFWLHLVQMGVGFYSQRLQLMSRKAGLETRLVDGYSYFYGLITSGVIIIKWLKEISISPDLL